MPEAAGSEAVELADLVEVRGDKILLKGSRVEAYRIAALLEGGRRIDDALADYPSLTLAQVEAARAYSKAHPNPGRPYPPFTVKRALRGAGLEALDGLAWGRSARGRRG